MWLAYKQVIVQHLIAVIIDWNQAQSHHSVRSFRSLIMKKPEKKKNQR